MDITYRFTFTASILRTFQHVLLHAGNYGVSIQSQLGLEGGDQR